MIDIHVHILPNIDDGPATMQEALQLARHLVHEGIRYAVATPHYGDEYPRRSAREVQERVFLFQQELNRHTIPLQLFPGHEVRIKSGLVEDIQAGRLATLNNSRYLLLELWETHWLPRTEQVLFELQTHGIVPILAHPERYQRIQKEPALLQSLLEKGVLTQITASSLLGKQGNTARRCAETLLKRGFVSCIASDAHDVERRAAHVRQSLQCVKTLVGANAVTQMSEIYPITIINNEAWTTHLGDVQVAQEVRKAW